MEARELLEKWAAREWKIEREILDRLSGQASSFSGTAAWRPMPSSTEGATQYSYEEQGTHHLNARAYPAVRRYLYRAEDSFVRVCFEDGRDFYAFNCEDGRAAACRFSHSCGPDLYEGSLELELAPVTWRLTWEVRGPKKNLRIRTRGF